MVHYSFHYCSPPVPTLIRINPDHALLYYVLKVHFIIILQPASIYSKWLLSLKLPAKNLYAILLSPILATYSAHFILTD